MWNRLLRGLPATYCIWVGGGVCHFGLVGKVELHLSMGWKNYSNVHGACNVMIVIKRCFDLCHRALSFKSLTRSW
jgi:hypothetical protein